MSDSQQKIDPNLLWTSWVKSAIDYWQTTGSTMQALMSASTFMMTGQNTDGWGKPQDLWKTFVANTPGIQELMREAVFPETGVTLARTFFDGCMQFQDMLKSVAGGRQDGQNASFARIQQDMFEAWLEFHQRDIQPLLKMPQVGLTRFYQEKVNQLLDRFGSFQTVLAEFQAMLYLPMEKSIQEMREKLDPKKLEQSADFKEYYKMWISILEGRYMELFRSEEWNRNLRRLVEEASEFKVSRNEILIDFIQFLPVPTNRDMDDVYKELYHLKKMVKKLTKQMNQQEPDLQ